MYNIKLHTHLTAFQQKNAESISAWVVFVSKMILRKKRDGQWDGHWLSLSLLALLCSPSLSFALSLCFGFRTRELGSLYSLVFISLCVSYGLLKMKIKKKTRRKEKNNRLSNHRIVVVLTPKGRVPAKAEQIVIGIQQDERRADTRQRPHGQSLCPPTEFVQL